MRVRGVQVFMSCNLMTIIPVPGMKMNLVLMLKPSRGVLRELSSPCGEKGLKMPEYGPGFFPVPTTVVDIK
jgi:hypothetical protein